MESGIPSLTCARFAFLVLLLLSIAKSVAASSSTKTDPTTGEPTCEIEGDADLYGLGVRLGMFHESRAYALMPRKPFEFCFQ